MCVFGKSQHLERGSLSHMDTMVGNVYWTLYCTDADSMSNGKTGIVIKRLIVICMVERRLVVK